MTAITLTAAELAAYRALRAPQFGQMPPRPEQARIIARAECAPATGPEWHENRRDIGHHATETRDGFALAYRVTPSDEWASIEDLGVLAERPAPGYYDRTKIDAPTLGFRYGASDLRYVKLYNAFRGEYAYGIKSNYGTARAADYALATTRAELALIEQYLAGDIMALCVSVTVRRAGVELARVSCGTEAEINALPHFSELAAELAEEAIDTARAKLAELCAA